MPSRISQSMIRDLYLAASSTTLSCMGESSSKDSRRFANVINGYGKKNDYCVQPSSYSPTSLWGEYWTAKGHFFVGRPTGRRQKSDFIEELIPAVQPSSFWTAVQLAVQPPSSFRSGRRVNMRNLVIEKSPKIDPQRTWLGPLFGLILRPSL